MERFVYFHNGSTFGLVYPVESFQGAHPASDTTLELYFTPITEEGYAPGKDNDVITLTLSSNNVHKGVMLAVGEAMGELEENFTVIFDSSTGEKIHSSISSFGYTPSSDP